MKATNLTAVVILCVGVVINPQPSMAAGTGTKPQTWEEFMTVDETATIQDLPPLADAAARKQAFAERDNPENIEKLAIALFSHWDFNERRASLDPQTSRLDAEKAEVVKLYNEKSYDAALKAYRSYLLNKVQILWSTKPIPYAARQYNDRFNKDYKGNYAGTLKLLLSGGAFQMPVTKETVRLGMPGAFNWEWQTKGERNPWDNLVKPEIEYFCGSAFDRLWWKFMDTKDTSYLDLWQAYLDDYTLNAHFLENLSSLNLDLGKQGQDDAMGFFFALARLSSAIPEGSDMISAPAVARMILRQLTLIVPQSLFYNRQQSNNHSPGTVANMLHIVEYLHDFKLAKTIATESRRQFETYGTMQSRPDGAGPGRLPEYAMHEYRENIPTVNFFQKGRFDWFTPMLNREYRDRMVARERFLIHMLAPTGELVLTQKNDRTLSGVEDKFWHFNTYYPEVFNDPDMLKIAGRISKNMTRPNWVNKVPISPEKPIANMGMGGGENDQPSYTSYSYPYDRINVMSSGWDPENDQFGVFLGSSFAGRGDALMKENKATNHLNISAYNKHFFCNGVDYAYNYLSSPVLVDGQQQFNGAGEGPTSRRAMANTGLEPISQDRTHFSSAFDLVEGTYAGAYATTGDHDPEYYDYKNKLDALQRSIWGVSHHRVVQFVKEHGLWIVTDLMTSEKPRDYAQQWWSWLRNDKSPDGFLLNELAINDIEKSIKSNLAEEPNYTMYHVGPADLDASSSGGPSLKYDPIGLKPQPDEKTTGMRMDRHPGVEFVQLRGAWKSQGGRSQLVTVIYPRRTKDDDLTSLTYLKREDGQTNGFVAKLKDGSEVIYTASLGKADRLQADTIQSTAESLLVVKEADGKIKGMVLGCSEISGGNLTKIASDFEFNVSGSNIETASIFRPIEPVKIEPGLNAFTDPIQVTMKTPTEGTEIRYTTDGSDPKLDSSIYSGPITFTDTVLLKTRAFRQGLKKMPPLTENGTEMTGVTNAVYTKAEFHEPNTSATDLKPGLSYAYHEAKWPSLLFGVNLTSPPIKQGEVTGFLDTTPKTANKDQPFAFEYQGYLNIPTDGVYTLYAPEEFVVYRPLAGYDLKLELGYQIQTDNGKIRPVKNGSPLEEWYPATRRHAFGTWSIALKSGLQPLRVYYADTRPGGVLQYNRCEYPGWNVPGLTKVVWDGTTPNIEISGPGLPRQPIPAEWLKHE